MQAILPQCRYGIVWYWNKTDLSAIIWSNNAQKKQKMRVLYVKFMRTQHFLSATYKRMHSKIHTSVTWLLNQKKAIKHTWHAVLIQKYFNSEQILVFVRWHENLFHSISDVFKLGYGDQKPQSIVKITKYLWQHFRIAFTGIISRLIWFE